MENLVTLDLPLHFSPSASLICFASILERTFSLFSSTDLVLLFLLMERFDLGFKRVFPHVFGKKNARFST